MSYPAPITYDETNVNYVAGNVCHKIHNSIACYPKPEKAKLLRCIEDDEAKENSSVKWVNEREVCGMWRKERGFIISLVHANS